MRTRLLISTPDTSRAPVLTSVALSSPRANRNGEFEDVQASQDPTFIFLKTRDVYQGRSVTFKERGGRGYLYQQIANLV